MIAECFHKARSEITDSGSTSLSIGDGAISSADPQVVPTSSAFNDFNSEYYATIAAAQYSTAAFNCCLGHLHSPLSGQRLFDDGQATHAETRVTALIFFAHPPLDRSC